MHWFSAEQSILSSIKPDVLFFGFLSFLTVFLLIAFIEAVALQWIRWGTFKASFQISFWMNLASIWIGFLILSLVHQSRILGLLLAWMVSIGIESFVLKQFSSESSRFCWFAGFFANSVSFLLLIIPAVLFLD